MSIESLANSGSGSSSVTYGAWVKMSSTVVCSGNGSILSSSASSSSYEKSTSFTASGSKSLYPGSDVRAGDVVQVYNPSKITNSTDHKKTSYFPTGGGSLVSFSEGAYSTSTSPLSVQTYNGAGALATFKVSYTCNVTAKAGYTSGAGYAINGAFSSSYVVHFDWWYRQVYGYSTGQKLDEQNNTSKGILSKITDFFSSFFSNLINSVISLFVPSSDEMSALFDQLNQFFSDRFGFLYAPFDYMIRLCGVFTSSTGETSLTFPGFSIMGEQVWSDMTYDLASDELVGTILGYVRTGTGILLAGYFIMYLQGFFKERFGTG